MLKMAGCTVGIQDEEDAFSEIENVFKYNRAKMALVRSPERSRFIQCLPNAKLDLDIDQTNILVKFHHY
ncbi:hypothetical protein DPMN_053205 [Dreissena polymorpha]|uniref:Uncharacterized protein n=1 Tax=Dreissena polymorpha TaxID=45954 RepID=A0A9D4CKY3_DREPO|nr:hypothetical protein DPMN_053205 [Dreissena polymorpha]